MKVEYKKSLEKCLCLLLLLIIYIPLLKHSHSKTFGMKYALVRITASVAHDILRTKMDKPAQSIIRKICSSPGFYTTNVPSLKWGLDNESTALDGYKRFHCIDHPDMEISDCGLKLLSDTSYIGATPDGIFNCKFHDQQKLIEIKCPYKMRETVKLEDALLLDPNFYIDKDGNIKRNHKYYTQIQLQLFVFNQSNCDFVVWTPNWLYCTTVARDDSFIDTMITVIKEFYCKHIIPELLTRKIECARISVPSPIKATKDQTEKLYCFCKSAYTDDEIWIGCDSIECKWEWFHLSCVKLKRIPKGNWYCPVCRKGKKRKL